jgi:hypothetical protein
MHHRFEASESMHMASAQRIERKLTEWSLSLQYLLWYADEGKDMLNRIVTGDKTWVHHYQPESKCASSMQLKHPSSPSTTKLEV